MVPWWWSWLLAGVGVLGLWLAGSRRKIGWAVGVGAQLLWVAYALHTGQYGFLASAVGYGTVYARNWIAWRRAEPERRALERQVLELEQQVERHARQWTPRP